LRNESSQAVNVRQLESINIYAQGSGKNAPLGQVARIVPQWQLAKIKRRDLYHTLTVTCDAKSGFTAAGIVINNAIALLDRIQIEQDRSGRASIEVIIAAAQQRFRPILLTTCTTTLGLIPLYLGGGLMWEPMAVAIMVGLLFATVITLLFVPVLYKMLFAVKN
jgi:multidrug efflux pump subunit AcrB